MRRVEIYGKKPLYLRLLSLFERKRGFVMLSNRFDLSGLDLSPEEM